jgi:hypothetical protein
MSSEHRDAMQHIGASAGQLSSTPGRCGGTRTARGLFSSEIGSVFRSDGLITPERPQFKSRLLCQLG